MANAIIGIDTGGTFTDAVLLHGSDGRVLATAKTATTHYQLSQGIATALGAVLRQHPVTTHTITAVCLSSTLATNSVVENSGARVAVLVIGYVKHFKLPVKTVAYVGGGHTVQGAEEQPLDLETLVATLSGLKNEVDAYGVCAAMAMHNPSHELVAEKAIGMLDPKPVFCSHRVSQQTGMRQRAATVALHARLMPVMRDFVSGVQTAMSEHHLHCPLLVVGGDGQALSAGQVVSEAARTVASGPACTAHFGAQKSSDCLVVDVGGTTTDIALITGGAPQPAADGCRIGEWQTHLEAIDMHTGGIGGDSLVQFDGSLQIGPVRVTPLALAAGLPDPAGWLGTNGGCRLLMVRPEAVEELPDNDLGRLLRHRGHLTPATIRRQTGLGGIPLDRQLEELTRRQLVVSCGFTPTDALHVLNRIAIGNRATAVAGAELLGAPLGLSAADFAWKVLQETEKKIENLILEYLSRRFWGDSLGALLAGRTDHPVLAVDFTLRLPLVGIGAAAPALLSGVAKRLRTTVSFPEHGEVGNAIGAALIGLAGLNAPKTGRAGRG